MKKDFEEKFLFVGWLSVRIREGSVPLLYQELLNRFCSGGGRKALDKIMHDGSGGDIIINDPILLLLLLPLPTGILHGVSQLSTYTTKQTKLASPPSSS
jgi:hypothetical protein